MKSITASIVSGFLGSGKTTLVRRLLFAAQTRGERVAFISNELGDLGIDQALLDNTLADAFVELAGGCVCCALSDDLHETLLQLRRTIDPDRIIIEASGEAIPHEIQLTLYRPDIADWITEESVVSLVSAAQLQEGRDLDGAFPEQLDCADLIILNQIDLIETPHTLQSLTAEAAAFNPDAPILTATHADVDTAQLFGPLSTRRTPPDHSHHHHHHTPLRHEVVVVPAGLSISELEVYPWAGEDRPLRIKGFVQAAEGLVVIQGVGRRIEVLPAPHPDAVDAGMVGSVVVICRADGVNSKTGYSGTPGGTR
ncbi:MAG: cobalamin biosynthesis protein CobW [Myxococcota bacterium]|jgi:cobalamin biosynthesis protein CobW